MIPVTPEDAQCSLNYAEKYNSYLAVGYRRALETIAGMYTEFRAEYQASGGRWYPAPHCCANGSAWGTKQQAERAADYWKADGFATRIVPRYVLEPEEA